MLSLANKLTKCLYDNRQSFIALAVVFLYLLPIIQPVYFSDDAIFFINSLIEKKLLGTEAWMQQANSTTIFWLKNNGRFSPLSIYLYYFLIYELSPICLKFCYYLFDILALIIASIGIGRLVQSYYFSLFIIFLLGSIQFCIHYHDAYNSFALLYPGIIICNFLSIILLLNFVDDKKVSSYYMSIIFFTLGLLFQEISLMFLVLIFIVIIERRVEIKFIIPYAIISLLLIVLLMYFRISIDVNAQYKGLQTNFKLDRNLYAFYCQVLGAIPLRNTFCYYFDIQDYLKIFLNKWPQILGLFFGVSYILYHNKKLETMKVKKAGLLVAISLLTLPAIFLCFSNKYIDELSEIKFYIPVFIQIIGIALLLYILFLRFHAIRIVLIVLFPIIISMSFMTNIQQVEQGQKSYYVQTNILRELAKIKSFVNSGDTIYKYNVHINDQDLSQLSSLYINKILYFKTIHTIDSAVKYGYLWRYNGEGKNIDFFINGQIRIGLNSDNLLTRKRVLP